MAIRKSCKCTNNLQSTPRHQLSPPAVQHVTYAGLKTFLKICSLTDINTVTSLCAMLQVTRKCTHFAWQGLA